MAPHVLAGAGETGLDFVGDQQAAGIAHHPCDALQVTGRHARDAFVGEQGVDQHGRHADALCLQRGDGFGHHGDIPLGHLLFAALGVIQAGNRHGPGMRREWFGTGDRGGQRGQAGGVAVVVVVTDDHPRGAGGEARHAQRHLVGFAASAGEHHAVQRLGEGRGEALGVVHDALVEIARVDVQRRRLFGHGRHHPRMAVADAGDVVVDVQVALAIRVGQPDTCTLHQLQWLVVEQRRCAAHDLVATVQQGYLRHVRGPPEACRRDWRAAGS
ncbi:hypothetical protein D9M71_415250 [compost metagenome]